jgi:hypothetical protein
LLFVLFWVVNTQADAQKIFIRQGANGKGTSWSDASGNLSAALRSASIGSEIWVAKGVYKTTETHSRESSFLLRQGVRLFGGFAGHETALSQRNYTVNETILTGEINQPGIADNSFHVVLVQEADRNTIIDGFTITAGNASSNASESDPSNGGGGLYIDGSQGGSNPVVRNCLITGNLGRNGAGVYIDGRSGESSPVFEACRFVNNEAGLDGGAIFNAAGISGKSNPMFNSCIFERNLGSYGGAICNANESGNCNISLDKCQFLENAAYLRGGAIFSLNGAEKCYLETFDCSFNNNYPDDQNMIFTSNTGRAQGYKIQTGSKP